MIKFVINVCAEKGTVRLTVRSCYFDKFQIFYIECSGHIEKIIPKFSIIATAAHGGSKMILFGTGMHNGSMAGLLEGRLACIMAA